MEIATNAVLIALLAQASTYVKDLDVPVPTPLQQTNVKAFAVGVSWAKAGPEIEAYLGYAGGYEFHHSHGCILSFDTTNSYLQMQRPSEIATIRGEAKFTEVECLSKARASVRRLGYTNEAALALLAAPPQVEVPRLHVGGPTIPRYIFTWRRSEPPTIEQARVEVNAVNLSIEDLWLVSPVFWRSPWPVTFGTTNVFQEPDPTEPARTNLQVVGVSSERAWAFISAVLPEVSGFCQKLGLPTSERLQRADIVDGGSEVSIKSGRLTASLRLKSGHLVVYHAGHVWAVHARDAYYTHPWRRDWVRASSEFKDPIRLTKEDAVQKVIGVLVERLGYSKEALFLTGEPVFDLVPDPTEAQGVRRYCFHWRVPEHAEVAHPPEGARTLPEISISAEVDAVSGGIKALNLPHRSLERPDPRTDEHQP